MSLSRHGIALTAHTGNSRSRACFAHLAAKTQPTGLITISTAGPSGLQRRVDAGELERYHTLVYGEDERNGQVSPLWQDGMAYHAGPR